MSRAGRRRKQGVRRTRDGRAIPEPINWLKLTANQPHRRDVPEAMRTDANAGSALGRLFLCGTISEPQFLAGQEYQRRIGAYRATIAGPKATAGSGKWSGCNPAVCLVDEEFVCVCAERSKDYKDMQRVVIDAGPLCDASLKVLLVEERVPPPRELHAASVGLTAIVSHLRIKARG